MMSLAHFTFLIEKTELTIFVTNSFCFLFCICFVDGEKVAKSSMSISMAEHFFHYNSFKPIYRFQDLIMIGLMLSILIAKINRSM